MSAARVIRPEDVPALNITINSNGVAPPNRTQQHQFSDAESPVPQSDRELLHHWNQSATAGSLCHPGRHWAYVRQRDLQHYVERGRLHPGNGRYPLEGYD